jgi:hypothetical protein
MVPAAPRSPVRNARPLTIGDLGWLPDDGAFTPLALVSTSSC